MKRETVVTTSIEMPTFTAMLVFGLMIARPIIAIAEDDPRVPAKAQFEFGLEQYQNKDFLTALAAFEASYRLRKSAAALFNIAMCQNAVFRYIESYESFLLLLTENNFAKDDEMKKLAETAMLDILRKVGLVTLDGLADEAEVSVDGKVRVISGNNPVVLVEPGAHTIVVSKQGYLSKQIGVAATPGGHFSMNATLVPDPSAVNVDTALPRSLAPVPTVAPSSPPTIPASPADPSSPPPRKKALLVGGLTSTLTGVAGIGIGIAFGAVYKNSHDAALAPISKSNEAVDQQNKEDYEQYFPLASSHATDFAENEPKYRAVMTAGFAVGGTALAVGAVLLGAHARKQKEKPPGAIALSIEGVSITF